MQAQKESSMDKKLRLAVIASAAGLVAAAIGFGALSTGAQSVPVNPAPTPGIVVPANPPGAPPASPIEPPSVPASGANPGGGQLGVGAAPGNLPTAGTGPSQSTNTGEILLLGVFGLVVAAGGIVARRASRTN